MGSGFHRVLDQEGIESHIVDPASIMTSRRRRRAKTDRIDGEALVRALLAHQRGEPRVCAMVRVPTPEEEDRRRVSRELKAIDGRTGPACQSREGSSVCARRLGIPAAPPRPACATGTAPDR